MKAKKKKVVTQAWGRFSKLFCNYHKLPNGCELKLEYRPCEQYPKGRKVRNDFKIKRYRFDKTGKVIDSSTVSEMVAENIEPLFVNEVLKRNVKICLIGPNGEIFPGNKQIGNIKTIPGKPTQEELQEEQEIEYQIEQQVKIASMSIREDEYGLWNPEKIIPRAYLRALIDEHGKEVIEVALKKEIELMA